MSGDLGRRPVGSVSFGGPRPRIWVSRDTYPRDRCPARALREAAPPRRSAASAHVTAQSRSDAFSAAGCSASLVALETAAGRRESSGRTGESRGPGAPRWNRKWWGVAWAWLPGARSWGGPRFVRAAELRAREGFSGDPRRGLVPGCFASGVGGGARALASASWSWTPSHTHTPAAIGVPSCPRRASWWRLVTWARWRWHSLVRSLGC